MPRPPVPSEKAIARLNDRMRQLTYGLGVPTGDIRSDWPVSKIRAMLNVTNSDPTGRLSAQIKQAMLQGVL